MKILLATHNAGKLLELQQLFAVLGVELVSLAELGLPSPPEPHPTFLENALAKARHAAAASGLPALADDAGLCVDAFGGLPGVHTAEYAERAGRPRGDIHNVQLLLERLDGHPNRRASLVSTLVALRSPDDPEPLVAVGRVQGEIASVPVGAQGFGFDPVMRLPDLGLTFAQLDAAEKNRRSHRGQAARQMVALIEQRWLHPGSEGS